MNEFTLKVTGMDCPNCAQTVENGVKQLTGIEQCELNFTTEKLRVAGTAEYTAVVEKVRALGYDVAEPSDIATPPASPLSFWQFMWQQTETRFALLGAILILPGLLFTELGGFEHPLIHALSILAMLSAGWPIARSAWRALTVAHEVTINVLMSVAAVGAVLIGAYTEAGLVMVLFAIGESLEGYSAERARYAIRSLMSVVPQQAQRLEQDGTAVTLPVADLRVGDVVLVKPGASIPMDGCVRAGASAVNQAAITGESQLISKEQGDEVFASSLNGEGVLEIEVTRLAENNTISRLIRLVEEAQERRAPSQRFVDQFAKYYTPAVMVLAFLVAVVPPLFFGQPWLDTAVPTNGWLYRGLALLVVACPCALVISTPVSIVSAMANGAKNGVLFKGGVYLEQLAQIKAVAFDKTGTLTLGQPQVVRVQSALCATSTDTAVLERCVACDELVAWTAAVEARSEHPLAAALLQEAATRQVAQPTAGVTAVHALPGRGIAGQVHGRDLLIGSHRYFDEMVGHDTAVCDAARAEAQAGRTPLMVSRDGAYWGTISVADTVRPSSAEAISQLKTAGIQHIVMLTGDEKTVAQRIAAELGVTDVRAELLPEDKMTAVAELQQKFGAVAMVGDGINDAPALATANLGIAIGGAHGTGQAMETADITLMSDDLRQLPFAYRLSRATMRTIGVNVGLSIGIKLLFMGLVVAGVGTMWMAVLADVGTSLLVTLNGLRLLRF